MRKLNSQFTIKQRELEEECAKARTKYESELKIDLKKEKLIRDEKWDIIMIRLTNIN